MSAKRNLGYIEQILTILCLVALAVIVRPLLRGLAVVITDAMILVGLVILTFATLRRGRPKRVGPPEPKGKVTAEAAPERKEVPEPEPLPKLKHAPPKSEGDETDRQAKIDEELRELKQQVGKE